MSCVDTIGRSAQGARLSERHTSKMRQEWPRLLRHKLLLVLSLPSKGHLRLCAFCRDRFEGRRHLPRVRLLRRWCRGHPRQRRPCNAGGRSGNARHGVRHVCRCVGGGVHVDVEGGIINHVRGGWPLAPWGLSIDWEACVEVSVRGAALHVPIVLASLPLSTLHALSVALCS